MATPVSPNASVTTDSGPMIVISSVAEHIVIATFYGIIGTTAIVGNLFVIISVILSRKLRTITNVFVVNLSTTDLLVGSVMPLQILGIIGENGWPLAPWICSIIGALISSAIGCSVSSLALIAINRCILITKSRKLYQRIYTPLNVGLMVAASWLLTICSIVIPQAAGYGQLGYDIYIRLCVWDPTHQYATIYKCMSLAIVLVMLGTTSLCYSLIFRHVRRHMSSLAAHRQNSTNSQNRRIDIAITKNLAMVLCAFLICVLPFMITFFISAVSPNPDKYNHATAYLAIILALNSCLNPIIYSLKHPNFREVFGYMIKCQWSKIPEPSRFVKFIVKQSDKSEGSEMTGKNTTETHMSAEC